MKAQTWHGKRDVRVEIRRDRLPLDEPRAYERFQKKEQGAVKILLEP